MPKARRTRKEMDLLRERLITVAMAYGPLTVRQLFYRMVVLGYIDKSQREYKNTVVRLAGELRETGGLDWDWIVDETRWQRKPDSYGSLTSALEEMQSYYRKSIWDDQEYYLEVWTESDSCAGVVYGTTAHWDIPLMSAKGFASKAFCRSTAKTIEWRDKPAVILYLGDRDPSGVHIDRDIESKIRRYAPGIDLEFKRIAVTEEQVEEMDLPSRPPKKGDSRSKGFKGEAVEVEAIEPATLKQILSDEIESYIDQNTLEMTQLVERSEKRTLESIIETTSAA